MRTLVIAAHPDDETLGLGGTLLKHRAEGGRLTWVLMTHVREHPQYSDKFKQQREEEIEKVSSLYPFEKKFQLPFLATRLDTYPQADIVSALSKIIQEVEPETIYIPNRSDVHSDHRVTFETAAASTKFFRNPSLKRVLMYETSSETDLAPPFADSHFTPNVFVDISRYLERKLEILSVYRTELKKHPFPRSREGLTALATVRGAVIHVPYAEAFMLLREVR